MVSRQLHGIVAREQCGTGNNRQPTPLIERAFFAPNSL
jgi:hypothetical protein